MIGYIILYLSLRVGRTGRQGEKGFSYSLFTRNMAPLTKGLISLLSACGQQCEPNLLKLAEEFEAGDVLESELVAEEEGEGDEDEEEKGDASSHTRI